MPEAIFEPILPRTWLVEQLWGVDKSNSKERQFQEPVLFKGQQPLLDYPLCVKDVCSCGSLLHYIVSCKLTDTLSFRHLRCVNKECPWQVALSYADKETGRAFDPHQLGIWPSVMPGMPEFYLFNNDVTAMGVLHVLTALDLAPSTGQARKLVQQGVVFVDDIKINDPKLSLTFDFNKAKYYHVRIGKSKLNRNKE